jgi:methyl-accepting chemotaxis protein
LPAATDAVKAFNTWMREQDGYNKVLRFTIEIMRALENAFLGLKLTAQALTVAFGVAFETIVKGIVGVVKPLDMLLDGFVKLGWIASNPLQELVTFTEDFRKAQTQAFGETLDYIERANAKYDRLKAKIGETKKETQEFGTMSAEALMKSVQGTENATQAMDNYAQTVSGRVIPAQQQMGDEMQNAASDTEELVRAVTQVGDAAEGSAYDVQGLASATYELNASTQQLQASTQQLTYAAQNLNTEAEILLGYGQVAESVFWRDPDTGNVFTQVGLGLQPGQTHISTGQYWSNPYFVDPYTQWLLDNGGGIGRPPGYIPSSYWEPEDPSPGSPKSSSVNINVNQKVSRSDVVNIATEIDRTALRA